MKIRNTTALAVLVAATAGSGAVMARADTADGYQIAGSRTVTVSYRELDLTRPEGVEVLYRRVAAAAKVVCGPDERQLHAVAIPRDCIQVAIDRAIRDAGKPRLTALHASRIGAVPELIAGLQ